MNPDGQNADLRMRVAELEQQLEQERRDSQHRVRNILAVIRSIARRTDLGTPVDDEQHALLNGRLAAFCRAQAALLRNPARGVELGALVGDELLAAGMGLDDADVPDAPLLIGAGAVNIMSLIVHELVGLMDDANDLAVTWAEPSSGGATIKWRARVGRGVEAEDMTFLREMVDQAIGYELSGEGRLDVADDWLTCKIILPAICVG